MPASTANGRATRKAPAAFRIEALDDVATVAKAGRGSPPKSPPIELADTGAPIEIGRLQIWTLEVPLISTSPLLMHRFAEKAKRTILGAQHGEKLLKEVRDEHAEFLAARHMLNPETHGVPTLALKAATVSAARFFGTKVTMTSMRQALRFVPDGYGADGTPLTAIEIGQEPIMREDYVRINNGRGTDLRYRPMYPSWRAKVTVRFVPSTVSERSVLALIDGGGQTVGIGDWRQEKGGDFGAYMIDTSRPVVTKQ